MCNVSNDVLYFETHGFTPGAQPVAGVCVTLRLALETVVLGNLHQHIQRVHQSLKYKQKYTKIIL